jgi:redox-sensitive bicupin YhaK (pirin superfamily)
LLYRGTYDGWGFHPADLINITNVKQLVPLWSFSTGELGGHEAPLLANAGVIFIYVGALAAGKELTRRVSDNCHAWVQVVRGEVRLNGMPLTAGDGAAIGQEPMLQIRAPDAAELLLEV